MNLTTASVLSCCLVASSAIAQEPSLYDGTWRASGQGFIDSEFLLKGGAGSWKVFATAARRKNDPCIGLERPIVVQRSTPEELVFLINGSKVREGCPNIVVALKPLNSNTLEGQFGSSLAIKASRQ